MTAGAPGLLAALWSLEASSPPISRAAMLAPAGPRKIRARRMPFSGVFETVSPGEFGVFPLDFSPRLAPGDSLASVVSATLTSAQDPAAAALMPGGAVAEGNVVAQWLGGAGTPTWVPLATYVWEVTALTVAGATVKASAQIQIAAN